MDLIGKPRGKSMVWIYFGFKADERGRPLNSDEAICRLCRKIVLAKGNTTNLRSHLKRRHPVEFLTSLAPSTSGALSEAQGNADQPSAVSSFKTLHVIVITESSDVDRFKVADTFITRTTAANPAMRSVLFICSAW